MADDDDDDFDDILEMADDDDEDQQSTAAAAPPPAAAAASGTYVMAAASSSAQPAQELEGNENTPVFMLYKKVMESVFVDVRHIVEQEGLEPGVAIELRNRWTERMNRSQVLNHMYTLSEPTSNATNAGGGQQYVPLHLHPPESARVGSAPVNPRPSAPFTSGRGGKVRGYDEYDAPPTARPPATLSKPSAGGKKRKGSS